VLPGGAVVLLPLVGVTSGGPLGLGGVVVFCAVPSAVGSPVATVSVAGVAFSDAASAHPESA
jgi:hypothetical protein